MSRNLAGAAVIADELTKVYRIAVRKPGLWGSVRQLLNLGEFFDTPVRRLSLGQRMRADLAATLIHRPRVLFLDELTIGLDVMAKVQVREFLVRMNKDYGVTILLTTRDLGDIEELCRRVMVINHGKLMFDGGLESLITSAGLPTTMQLRLSAMSPGLSAGQTLRNGRCKLTGVDYPSRSVDLAFDRRKVSAAEVLLAAQELGEVRDVSLVEAGMEETVKWLLTRES